MIKRHLLFFLYFIMSQPFDALAKIVVLESLPDENIVVIEARNEEQLELNQKILFSKEGKQCIGAIDRIDGKVATVETKSCSMRNLIRAGDGVSLSRVRGTVRDLKSVDETVTELRSQPDKINIDEPLPYGISKPKNNDNALTLIGTKPTFGFTLGLLMPAPMRFLHWTMTDGDQSVSGYFEQRQAQGFNWQIDYLNVKQDSWGWRGLLGYDLDRKITTVFAKFSDGTILEGSYVNSPVFSCIFAEAQAVYLWKTNYFFIGANISFPFYTPPPEASPVKSKGGGGASLGFGFGISETYSIEVFARTLYISLVAECDTTKINYGPGDIGDVGFGFRRSF